MGKRLNKSTTQASPSLASGTSAGPSAAGPSKKRKPASSPSSDTKSTKKAKKKASTPVPEPDNEPEDDEDSGGIPHGAYDDTQSFVVDGVLSASAATALNGRRTWFYRPLWHGYRLDETTHESHIPLSNFSEDSKRLVRQFWRSLGHVLDEEDQYEPPVDPEDLTCYVLPNLLVHWSKRALARYEKEFRVIKARRAVLKKERDELKELRLKIPEDMVRERQLLKDSAEDYTRLVQDTEKRIARAEVCVQLAKIEKWTPDSDEEEEDVSNDRLQDILVRTNNKESTSMDWNPEENSMQADIIWEEVWKAADAIAKILRSQKKAPASKGKDGKNKKKKTLVVSPEPESPPQPKSAGHTDQRAPAAKRREQALFAPAGDGSDDDDEEEEEEVVVFRSQSTNVPKAMKPAPKRHEPKWKASEGDGLEANGLLGDPDANSQRASNSGTPAVPPETGDSARSKTPKGKKKATKKAKNLPQLAQAAATPAVPPEEPAQSNAVAPSAPTPAPLPSPADAHTENASTGSRERELWGTPESVRTMPTAAHDPNDASEGSDVELLLPPQASDPQTPARVDLPPADIESVTPDGNGAASENGSRDRPRSDEVTKTSIVDARSAPKETHRALPPTTGARAQASTEETDRAPAHINGALPPAPTSVLPAAAPANPAAPVVSRPPSLAPPAPATSSVTVGNTPGSQLVNQGYSSPKPLGPETRPKLHQSANGHASQQAQSTAPPQHAIAPSATSDVPPAVVPPIPTEHSAVAAKDHKIENGRPATIPLVRNGPSAIPAKDKIELFSRAPGRPELSNIATVMLTDRVTIRHPTSSPSAMFQVKDRLVVNGQIISNDAVGSLIPVQARYFGLLRGASPRDEELLQAFGSIIDQDNVYLAQLSASAVVIFYKRNSPWAKKLQAPGRLGQESGINVISVVCYELCPAELLALGFNTDFFFSLNGKRVTIVRDEQHGSTAILRACAVAGAHPRFAGGPDGRETDVCLVEALAAEQIVRDRRSLIQLHPWIEKGVIFWQYSAHQQRQTNGPVRIWRMHGAIVTFSPFLVTRNPGAFVKAVRSLQALRDTMPNGWSSYVLPAFITCIGWIKHKGGLPRGADECLRELGYGNTVSVRQRFPIGRETIEEQNARHNFRSDLRGLVPEWEALHKTCQTAPVEPDRPSAEQILKDAINRAKKPPVDQAIPLGSQAAAQRAAINLHTERKSPSEPQWQLLDEVLHMRDLAAYWGPAAGATFRRLIYVGAEVSPTAKLADNDDGGRAAFLASIDAEPVTLMTTEDFLALTAKTLADCEIDRPLT